MDMKNRSELKETAAQRLAAASYDPRRLVLVNTLVTIGVSVLSLALSTALDGWIDQYGGLSGMGTRQTLSTIQEMIDLLPVILAVFWDVGYVYSLMHISRGEPAGLGQLPEGFRRFGKVVPYRFAWLLVYLLVTLAAVGLSMLVFLMTPLSNAMVSVVNEGLASGAISEDGTILDYTINDTMTQAMIPLMVIMGVAMAGLLLFVSYRYRMGMYALLDGKRGGFAAMGQSNRLMQGHKADLFRLDLSFWWYYLLQVLIYALAYLDLILPVFGVTLPFSEEVAGYLAYGLYLVALLAMNLLLRNRVEMTYIQFYEALRAEKTPYRAPDPAPQPQRQPWNYG